jgi:hypothetical protein
MHRGDSGVQIVASAFLNAMLWQMRGKQ